MSSVSSSTLPVTAQDYEDVRKAEKLEAWNLVSFTFHRRYRNTIPGDPMFLHHESRSYRRQFQRNDPQEWVYYIKEVISTAIA